MSASPRCGVGPSLLFTSRCAPLTGLDHTRARPFYGCAKRAQKSLREVQGPLEEVLYLNILREWHDVLLKDPTNKLRGDL